MTGDRRAMEVALQMAREAGNAGEIPVGAVLMKGETVIAREGNRTIRDQDPTAHAEMLVLRQAASRLSRREMQACTLYSTLEPCPMCAGAAVIARIGRVVYGAFDPQAGCAGSVYNLIEDPTFTNSARCEGGLMEAQCRELLDSFFSRHRGGT